MKRIFLPLLTLFLAQPVLAEDLTLPEIKKELEWLKEEDPELYEEMFKGLDESIAPPLEYSAGGLDCSEALSESGYDSCKVSVRVKIDMPRQDDQSSVMVFCDVSLETRLSNGMSSYASGSGVEPFALDASGAAFGMVGIRVQFLSLHADVIGASVSTLTCYTT